MQIGLIDVDGHNFPNLPLMKISAWHKKEGATLRDLGYNPYVMIYGKEHTRPGDPIRRIQRWVNSRVIFEKVNRFEDYLAAQKPEKAMREQLSFFS